MCVFLLKVKELNHVLEAEKSCRTDLEMYVAVLNTQKSVLQEDAEKLRKELHDGTWLYFLFLKILLINQTNDDRLNTVRVVRISKHLRSRLLFVHSLGTERDSF